MKALLFAACLALGCGAPKVEPPPPIPEEPDFPDCAGKIKAGMEPGEVEVMCGPPHSRLYVALYPTVMGFKYCVVLSCRVMLVYFFYDGRLTGWGTVYEVLP